MSKLRLREVAKIIRSKNAGPFELTLDVFFRDKESFEQAESSGFFTPSLIARLYGISDDEVLSITWFEPAHALKITIIRPLPSGSPGDTDVFGAQQHAPLLELTLPWNG
ncbi:MAG: DUF4387 domain-containing protein [Deltaproteobacteria bacterium]|nr:MAG: DUF4387 domain-containing protein [Deltaproteobacteria bacterium]